MIKVKGVAGIEKALRDLDITAARKAGIARRALENAAEPMRADWASKVDVESGDYRESIKVGNRAATKATRRFKRGAGQDIVERFIGIDATVNERLPVYAVIEEFGAPNQPANPAGRQAWESGKQAAMDSVGDHLWSEIKKVRK